MVVFCPHNDKPATKLAYVLDDWSPTDSKFRVIKKYSRDCALTPWCFSLWQMGLAGVSLPDVCPQILNISEMKEISLSVSASLSVSLSSIFPDRCVADMHNWVICDFDLEEKACPSHHISHTQIHTRPNPNRSVWDYFWSESFHSRWQQGCILRICMADALWLGNRKQWITWRLCPQPSDAGAALSPRE